MATKGRRSFGQRLIDLELRLRDGEVNLVGGIFDNAETQSLSGYPLLSRIPIPRYFFAQIGKQRQEDEIIFAITPHIVHPQELTEENLRLVDLSMGASVSVRHTDPRKVSALTTAAAHEAGSSQNGWKAATDQHETAQRLSAEFSAITGRSWSDHAQQSPGTGQVSYTKQFSATSEFSHYSSFR